jgi:amino acid transporter
MTIDAVLNIFLITYFTGVLQILAVSNIGYVFATCCAISGFLLLRKDRPNWPRPIRLPNIWVPIASALLAINLALLVAGGFLYSGGFLGITGYGYGWDKTRTGLIVLVAALLLYIYRHVVQDKIPLRLREEIPQTPEELLVHPELAPAHVGAAEELIATAGPAEPQDPTSTP